MRVGERQRRRNECSVLHGGIVAAPTLGRDSVRSPLISSFSFMSLSVTSTLVTHWKYLNEGGASLVLAYTGPSDIRFDNSILRLRKSPIHPSTPHQPIPTPADDPTVVFQAHVISPLLNSRYLPTLHIVALGPLWLSELARSIHDLRPKTRSDADQIDLTRASGVLATNVIGTTGIAVEIK